MAEPFRLPLPMWRVQYDLLGGNRRMFSVLGICALLLIVGFLGYRRIFQSTPLPALAGYAINLLGGIQVFLLVMGGCNAVYRAMLRDYDTRMLESHRLTPMSNVAVVLGYFLGPNLQMLSLCGLVLIFGTVLCFVAGVSAEPWLMGNLIAFMGATTLWAVTIFVGLRVGKPLNPSGFLVVVSIFGSLWLLLLPGAGLLLSGYATVLGATTMWGLVTPAPGLSALLCGLHVFLTTFWLLVAAHKYRRPDLPGLNGPRGLFFLAIWLVLATMGVALFHPIAKSLNFPTDSFVGVDVMWSVMLGTSVLVAVVPLNGAVECRVLARRGSSMRGAMDRVPSFLVVFLAVLLIVAVAGGLGWSTWRKILDPLGADEDPTRLYATAWGLTALVSVAALLAARAVLLIGHGLLRSPMWFLSLYVTVFWAAPPLGDLILSEALREYGRDASLTWAFGTSPAGTLGIVWNRAEAPLRTGLIIQCALAVLLTVLVSRLARTRKSEAIAAAA
jgi:hypothetical protein